ncbi:MAG: Vi polysaccharide biosynthesis UDP-N-acetylglucosamine C-6 dehydrogenase TviB, partial [Flavobacteriia bacterium]
SEVEHEYKLKLTSKEKLSKYDAIILAVSHDEFISINLDEFKLNSNSVVYDTKAFFDKKLVDGRL